MAAIRVIGCGNAYRRDDGAGLFVAERLRQAVPEADVQLCSGEATELLGRLRGTGAVVIVDAMRSGRPSGAVARFRPFERELPKSAFVSSHAFGVAEAVRLARALNLVPSTLVLYGIEGMDFSMGEGLSPAVRRSAERLAGRLGRLLSLGTGRRADARA